MAARNPKKMVERGLAMEQGYKAHASGLLLAQCPYPPAASRLRRLWRAGWMEREAAVLRVASRPPFSIRNLGGRV